MNAGCETTEDAGDGGAVSQAHTHIRLSLSAPSIAGEPKYVPKRSHAGAGWTLYWQRLAATGSEQGNDGRERLAVGWDHAGIGDDRVKWDGT